MCLLVTASLQGWLRRPTPNTDPCRVSQHTQLPPGVNGEHAHLRTCDRVQESADLPVGWCPWQRKAVGG